MISSIKPFIVKLLPGEVSVNRIDVNTSNWTKDVIGVKISYVIQSVEMRDWVEHTTHQVTSTDENGDEITVTEPIDITTQREHIAWTDYKTITLTKDQWDNWPAGDQDSDNAYIFQCVLENTGIELE